jgi:hypothetical protein
MNKLISTAGDVAAVVGILLCVVTGVARLFGTYAIAGLGTMVLFTVGVGLMVFACLAKLHLLTVRTKSG